MVIAFKFLIEDADAIPELWVLNISQGIQSSLIGLEWVLQVFDEQVAVAKRCPSWTIHRINWDYLQEVLNSSLIISVWSTAFSQTVDSFNLKLRVVSTHGARDLLLLLFIKMALSELSASLKLHELMLLLSLKVLVHACHSVCWIFHRTVDHVVNLISGNLFLG